MAVIRHLVLNQLKTEKTSKWALKINYSEQAGMKNYLLQLLTGSSVMTVFFNCIEFIHYFSATDLVW
jgi:hypothetical protein